VSIVIATTIFTQTKIESFIMAKFIALTLAALMASVSATSHFETQHLQTKNTPKAKMMSKLIDSARPTEKSEISRGLEQGSVNLGSYDLKFEQCQFVRSYDDELAQDESSSTILSTRRFVMFRLCPSGKCNSCNSDYGEYVIDLDAYVEIATDYYLEERQNTCNLCNQVCAAEDDVTKSSSSVNCNTCADYCATVEGLQENGMVESYQYAQCLQLYDNGNSQIYASAKCSNNGSGIKIGAFSDADCSTPEKNTDIEDYIGNGMSFYDDILDKLSDSSSCVSCNANQNDDAANGQVAEICSNLYDTSAKCESKHGFDNYWKDYDDFTNQYLQEDMVCDFISSLKNGNYDQYGEIILTGLKRIGSGGATGIQKFLLSSFFIGSVALGFYSARINAQLNKGSKADLSAQGGAMA